MQVEAAYRSWRSGSTVSLPLVAAGAPAVVRRVRRVRGASPGASSRAARPGSSSSATSACRCATASSWRPTSTGRTTSVRHPVLLERTPYDRGYVPIAGLDTLALIEAGYVDRDARTAAADSGPAGTFTPFVDEARDGVDAIAWCAAQPWSNGRVGMIGGSYVGATQWLAAGARAAGARGDRAARHRVGLLRGLGLPGRRVPARVLAALEPRVAGAARSW